MPMWGCDARVARVAMEGHPGLARSRDCAAQCRSRRIISQTGSSGLPFRGCSLERGQVSAGGVDPDDPRIRLKVQCEAPRVEHLRHQTYVGHGRRITVAESPGRAVPNQPTLDGVEPKPHPVPIPGLALRLGLPQLIFEI